MPDGLHPDLRGLIARAIERFVVWTGYAPTVVAAAPGRVNLIGEHTDYNDGFVLPVAIDRWCVAAGAPGVGRVRSDNLNAQTRYNPSDPDATALADHPWARYPVGVVWCISERASEPCPALDILLASGVPLGAGLSSSAAVEIATASLCNQAFALDLSPQELASIGRRAEHEFAGVPCGIMDQLISASATAGAATLIDCRSLACRSVPLPTDARIVIADSGVRHVLASGEYAARRESCLRAAAALGLASLRDATPDMLEHCASSMSGRDLACARHVVDENARVLEFVEAVRVQDLAAAGMLMNASHASLRDDYHVSCTELDMLVAAATAIPGVFGSRMTGGGFGGCTVTLCRTDAVGALCDALGRVGSRAGRPSMKPFVASPVGGASAWFAS